MKKIALFICALFAAAALTGCGSPAAPSGDAPGQQEEMRILIDAAGREVALPQQVETIIPLGNTPRMITYLGLAEQAVGIGSMAAGNISPVTAYAYANQERWADIPIVGTDAAGATDYYPEEIIRLAPDIILCSYNKELADEIQTKTGIPVIAVPVGTLFGEDYAAALRLLAEACNVPERAEEVVAFIDACLVDLKERTAGIPQEEKPSVLGAAATFKGAHGLEGVYAKYAVFEAIAAKDVTEGIFEQGGGVLIDKEIILEWNPEYIFLDSSGVGLVQEDYAKNPGFYAHLQAVGAGNIYQYPSSTSYYSNVEIPLVNSYYAGSLLYPAAFQDVDFAEKANEIFRFFLGVEDYLSILEESGFGYDRVILGADNG